MAIEIAPVTHENYTYEEAALMCFFFEYNGKKGWRLPTRHEYSTISEIWGWHQDDDRRFDQELLRITPVRDL